MKKKREREDYIIEEIIKDFVCEKYEMDTEDFGCKTDCKRDCPTKDALMGAE